MLRLPTPQRPARRGYTLVELLVVIAIIGVLVGLIMAAVQRVRVRGDEFKAKADFASLDTALGQFKGKYNRLPPCSGGGPMNTFRLCSEYPAGVPSANPASTWPELAVLKSIFGRMDPNFNGLIIDATTAPKFILADASSTGAGAPATFNGLPVTKVAGPILLDPNQCLVFFLSGGVAMDYLGFASNPVQPFLPNAGPGSQRAQGTPFFEFKQDRMQKPTEWLIKHATEISNLPSPPAGFSAASVSRWEGGTDTLATLAAQNAQEPWFLDPWKTPYLYMATSGVGSGGDYPFHDLPAPVAPLLVGPWGGKISAFNNNANGPVAFREPNLNNKWLNHTTWQIVSAGPNGSQIDKTLIWGFGPGGQATFGKTAGYTSKDAGADDFANFRATALSVTD